MESHYLVFAHCYSYFSCCNLAKIFHSFEEKKVYHQKSTLSIPLQVGWGTGIRIDVLLAKSSLALGTV